MNSLFKCHRLTSRFRSNAVIACLALGISTGLAQTSYIVTDLGVLPGKTDSAPAAINNQGQVAGTSSLGNSSGEAAFRYDGVSREALEHLANRRVDGVSRGFAINDFGVVAGDADYFGRALTVRRATLFSNGSVTDIGTLEKAGLYSRANGLNASGQVVGFAGATLDSDKSRAFIWSKSTGMLDLGTLGGTYAQATAINDAGWVTGNSETASDRLKNAVHAFLYQPGSRNVMRDLGTLGGSFSYGTFVSPKNHVVGYSTINNFDSRVHAFLYDEVSMRDLGSLAGKSPLRPSILADQSVALGVNTDGEVVGYSYRADMLDASIAATSLGQQVAFIYRQGVMKDLNTLIGPAAKRYFLYSATAINDNGEMVATALVEKSGTFHAVLLTPIMPIR